MNYEDFEKKGLENIGIMEETGFLKSQGYSKNFWWKITATILSVLFIGCIGFIGYSIYDGKFQFNANPNILCEKQECNCNCSPPDCNCGEITCEPSIVNITINPEIFTGT